MARGALRALTEIDNLPAWLTTVTVRLCLDRLRKRTPELAAEIDVPETTPGPADEVALADTVGVALHVVLEHLTPSDCVAFVLHDSFGFEFPTIAAVLGTAPAAARKLTGDEAAILAGTPAGIDGQNEVATFFNGAAAAALAVFIGDRPGAAWFHRGARPGWPSTSPSSTASYNVSTSEPTRACSRG